MNLLNEISKWAETRPKWQQDAMRRLWSSNDLTALDIEELADLCKRRYGLSENSIESRGFFDGDDLGGSNVSSNLCLTAVKHIDNVNALAPNQAINLGNGLTVVFGANGAGKSGFARILKSACRARGKEDILGNVLSDSVPGKPAAEIELSLDGKIQCIQWEDDKPNRELSKISVLDSASASVYLRDKTDVAYRPFGLDIFDKLSEACTKVRGVLELQRKNFEIPIQLPKLLQNTAAANLIQSLSALTSVDDIRALGTLSKEEDDRLEELAKQLKTLRGEDPEKKIRECKLRESRIKRAMKIIESCYPIFVRSRIVTYKETCELVQASEDKMKSKREEVFRSQPMNETGGAEWLNMWNAAEKYSVLRAYPNKNFPVSEKGSRCVLCQQDLRSEGARRLEAFAELFEDQIKEAKDSSNKYKEEVRKVDMPESEIEGLEQEIRLESEEVGRSSKKLFDRIRGLRNSVLKGEVREVDKACIGDSAEGVLKQLQDFAGKLENRVKELREGLDPGNLDKLEKEWEELNSRKELGKNEKLVCAEVVRLIKLAAFELCLKDTETDAITRKSSKLTKEAVTKKLVKAFEQELDDMAFKQVEVELSGVGGGRGSFYHKLQLKRAKGMPVSNVVSEGEAKCIAIAAFFAELATADNAYPIVFDDPVSSLDHWWRDCVARRLVKEAGSRQVIVFTHDIVFLLALKEHGEEVLAEPVKYQYVRRESLGAGVVSDELPWSALRTKDRIGRLKAKHQGAEKTFRTTGRKEYDDVAIVIYGFLRETWERAVEEVLLAGVVERYRNSVQTLSARSLSDIEQEDLDKLEKGMTKASKWLPGHDMAGADAAPVPEPSELLEDIEILEKWVKGINSRRR